MVQLFHGGVRADRGADRRAAVEREHVDRGRRRLRRAARGDRDDIARVIDALRRRGGARRDRGLRRRRAARRARLPALAVPVAHDEPAHRRLGRRSRGPRAAGSQDHARRSARAARRASPSACGSRSRTSATRAGIDLDDNIAGRALARRRRRRLHPRLAVGRHADDARSVPTSHPLPLAARRAARARSRSSRAGKIWTREDAEAVLAHGADVVALGRAGDHQPRLAARRRTPASADQRPPVTRAELLERAVSPLFAGYLTTWKNFVAD